MTSSSLTLSFSSNDCSKLSSIGSCSETEGQNSSVSLSNVDSQADTSAEEGLNTLRIQSPEKALSDVPGGCSTRNCHSIRGEQNRGSEEPPSIREGDRGSQCLGRSFAYDFGSRGDHNLQVLFAIAFSDKLSLV